MMDPELIQKITALPWSLQIVMASGFCGYLVAYVGIRYGHKTTDTVFLSLAFGLVASLVISLPLQVPLQVKAALAFGASLLAGVLWRTVMRSFVRDILRKLNYSWSDDSLSAWDRLQEDSKNSPTQLTVEMDDGRYLFCTDTKRVMNLPFGPYVLGASGDVLMYVDRSINKQGEEREVPGTFSDDWGNLVTYIPKEHIRKIALRFEAINPRAGAEGG